MLWWMNWVSLWNLLVLSALGMICASLYNVRFGNEPRPARFGAATLLTLLTIALAGLTRGGWFQEVSIALLLMYVLLLLDLVARVNQLYSTLIGIQKEACRLLEFDKSRDQDYWRRRIEAIEFAARSVAWPHGNWTCPQCGVSSIEVGAGRPRRCSECGEIPR